MEGSVDNPSTDGTSRTTTLGQQIEKELQAIDCPSSTLPETSELIPEDNSQPLMIPLELINSTRVLSSSSPEQSTASLLENEVNEKICLTLPETREHIPEDNGQCLIPLEMINSTRVWSSSLPEQHTASLNENLSESPLSSASSTISSLSSAPSISTPESPKYILQSGSFDGFPVVSSVFSLQSVEPTALIATEPNRTKKLSTLAGQHTKKESKSSGKKKLDMKNTTIRQMPLYISSLQLHEKQLSTLHECTLRKFLETQGGFFKGKGEFTTMGLKAIFTTLQAYRLELTFQELTRKCFILFERKMRKLEKSKVKVFLEVLDSFLYLFDWYCHKNWPVITVAMYMYLPNAIDYSYYTWHGVCPTGWSEYCCAIIIREVIQFILDSGRVSPMLPLYSPHYFSSPSLYSSKLRPRLLPTAQNDGHGTPCGSTASCNTVNQSSEFSKTCADGIENVGTCPMEGNVKLKDAVTQTSRPSMNTTLQTSAARPIPILPKLDSYHGSVNEQLDKVTCEDYALTNREPGLEDKDVASCRRNIDTGSPKEDVSIDSDCNKSSSSLKITDANSIGKHDEIPCLDDVNVAMTTSKKSEEITKKENETTKKQEKTTKKQEKTRKREYFTCFIDKSNEGQDEPNNHIKIRIVKKSSEEDLDFDSPGNITLLRMENNKDLGKQSLPSDDTPMDIVGANHKTNEDVTSLGEIFETGDQQRDGDGRKEMKDSEGNGNGTAAKEVTDVGCDVTESDVMIEESQATPDSEDRGHLMETIEETSRSITEAVLNNVVSQISHAPAKQEASITIAQSSSPNDFLPGHSMDSNDNKVVSGEVICQRSRLFDALWSNRTPIEPRIHMSSGSCMSLGEFLEKYPLATTHIPQGTTIEIDNKTYDAGEVLNHFYTGVGFYCHNSSCKRNKICYSLATVENSSYITSVRPIHRSSIRAVIPQKKKKSLLPAPHQNIYDDVCVEKLILNSQTGTHNNVTKETDDSQTVDGNHGDGNTKDASSNVQGNTQPKKEHLSENRELLQQIDHLRKTATFLNELASGFEARLTNLNDTGKQVA